MSVKTNKPETPALEEALSNAAQATRSSLRPGQRILTPPPQDQLGYPDTYEAPPPPLELETAERALVQPVDPALIPEAAQVYHPNVAAAGGGIPIPPTPAPPVPTPEIQSTPTESRITYSTSGQVQEVPGTISRFTVPPLLHSRLEAPIKASEVWVAVTPIKTCKSFIGDRTYYLEKDKKVKVPKSVAEILGNSKLIYPTYG